jgi:hypothetical protein
LSAIKTVNNTLKWIDPTNLLRKANHWLVEADRARKPVPVTPVCPLKLILIFSPKRKLIEVTGMTALSEQAGMTRAEKIIWIFFAATSCQLALQRPSFLLVAGDRANLFSGLLCFLTLIVAVVFSKRGAINLKSPEFLISTVLTVLAVISGLVSVTPFSSSLRVFVLLTSGLGGFWCARILLNTPANQLRLQWLCFFLLAVMVLLSLTGYLTKGSIARFMPYHTHPLTNVILLLSFAPLALLGRKSRSWTITSLILLFFCYVALCLSERISVVFIPLGVFLVGAAWGALRWKYLMLIFLLMAMVVGVFHQKIIWHKFSLAYPYYRVENFPFSWSIAKTHPWFGIGLRAPRKGFLESYQVKYPGVSKEQFGHTVDEIVSADNLFLTLMVGLGFPFTLTYLAALGILLARLIRLVFRPPAGMVFHPLVLLFPLTVALVHFQLFDGLLFPQSCWFFHLLLGLIPFGAGNPAAAGVRPEVVKL